MSGILRPAPGVAWHVDDAGDLAWAAVVPDGDLLALNASATLVWTEVVAGGSAGQIVDRVVARACADGDRPRVAADIEELIAVLVAQGLVVVGAGARDTE